MAEVSIAYPTSLNTLYDEASSLKQLYEPIQLADAEIVPILQLPLAKVVFGHDSADESTLARVSSGEISYTTFLANKTKSISQTQLDGSTPEQRNSQLLHIGLAALFSFLQSNVTGPPLSFSPAELIIPSILRTNPTSLRAVRAHIIRDLSVDGEAAYRLTPNVELFAVAKAILADTDFLLTNGPLVARTARMRVNFLHQKMLSEITGTLQDAIYSDMEQISSALLNGNAAGSETAKFLLERALIHTHHGLDSKARADIDKAAAARNFKFALTGKLGKRDRKSVV